MTSQQAIEDINYATGIAKSAKESPLVGGPFGLMWGVLLSTTLCSHWAIVTGQIAAQAPALGLGNSHWTDRRAGSGTRLPVGGFCYLR